MQMHDSTEADTQQRKASFEEHVREVVHRVRGTLAELLSAAGADPARPQDMARRYGLNKNLTWKISRTICESDPYAAIEYIPGKASLKTFLHCLQAAGAPKKVAEAASQALSDFDHMVEVHAGDRDTFHIMLGNLTSNGESQRVEGYRRLAFRGNSAIWGAQSKVQLTTNFIAPGADSEMIDLAWLSGLVDFRRLRHDVVWPIASARKTSDDGSALPVGTFEPIDSEFLGASDVPLFGEYCSTPRPDVRTTIDSNGMLRFELVEGEVGNTASVSCIVGLYGRSFVVRYRQENDTLGEHIARINTPVELMILDLFVHRDLEYAMKPDVFLYSQLSSDPPFPSQGRDCGRLPIHEKVVDAGAGTTGIVTPEVPRYREMVDDVFTRLEWRAGDFQAYRFKMRFPPISTLAVLRYELPERP
jgi:hypothetical protein